MSVDQHIQKVTETYQKGQMTLVEYLEEVGELLKAEWDRIDNDPR